MRQKIPRLITLGTALMTIVAPTFYLCMLPISMKTKDPAALMETVGQAATILATIGLVMLVAGWIGRKR